MTTCLDPIACPNEKLYNITCNFSVWYIDYACNNNTCMRADGTYDCCSVNVYYCRYPVSLLQIPTLQPSTIMSKPNCNQICNDGSKINKCYWYESMRTNDICVENNNEYCCSHNRSDCCSTNQTGVYIVFGSMAGIIIIFAYYWYYVKKSHRMVAPEKDITEVESLDRYKMFINLHP